MQLPQFKKSKTEQAEPILLYERVLIVDPRLMKFNTEALVWMLVPIFPNTEAPEPRRAMLRIERVLLIVT